MMNGYKRKYTKHKMKTTGKVGSCPGSTGYTPNRQKYLPSYPVEKAVEFVHNILNILTKRYCPI